MKSATIACFAALALLAACSSDNTGGTAGAGGTTPGYGQAGGPGGPGGPGGVGATDLGAGGAAGQGAPGSEEDLVRAAGDRIYFNTDRSSLNDQAKATLDQQIGWLQRYPQVNIWIAGNCDERGTEEYNIALGERRANADRDYLVAHGIAEPRIQTISYGKSRPIDPASTPEAWAKNRNAITSVR
jgi:peptidoglycan-associated lipoprotein